MLCVCEGEYLEAAARYMYACMYGRIFRNGGQN